MRVLFLGDVVGRSGRNAVIEELPKLRARYRLDFVAINGENAAGGFGITEAILEELLSAGADVVTLGNHAWDQKEALVFIERQERLLRPINYPPGTPGKGAGMFKARNGADVLVINAMGLIFMPELACPFRAVDRELEACGLKRGADVILVDFHAEATSEKVALATWLDGRVTAVIGTHTHVQTNDARILPGGTAAVTDAGMTGPHDSVIGVEADLAIRRMRTRLPVRFEPAHGDVRVEGVVVDCSDAGRAERIDLLRIPV
jgi:2',3'-cyclic-nucleotide 2'-phosphodiesterase